MINYLENNVTELSGVVDSDLTFSHEVYGEGFYSFTLKIARLSNISDYIMVTLSERLLAGIRLYQGLKVDITGQFRSYNNYTDTGNKLVLTVFARELKASDEESTHNPNSIFLNGFICKTPVYRVTPFGREIADILIAVNRSYNKSDYIPCIAWGRNAKYAQSLKVGQNIKIWGRIQSREYQKKLDEDNVITKTAYEVSVSKLEIVEAEKELTPSADEDSVII